MNSSIQKILCEGTNQNFEEPSRHRIFQQGYRFSFRLTSLPLHPPFFLISQAVSFSSQQIFVTTCILLLPYFIIHGKPFLAHRLYASRYQTPSIPAFALLHAFALISNPQQICHSYSDTQIHIMKCNFFRFIEREDFSKEDGKPDQNICVFLFSRYNSQIPRAVSRNGKVT